MPHSPALSVVIYNSGYEIVFIVAKKEKIKNKVKRLRFSSGEIFEKCINAWYIKWIQKYIFSVQKIILWVSKWWISASVEICNFWATEDGSSVQFNSVAQLCLTLWDPMDHSTSGLPVHHQLLEYTQTHVHWVGDAIQPSHPLSSPSPPALNLSKHQGLFKWVNWKVCVMSSHQVAKVLEFQLQHQSFQWTLKTDLL